ncbi:hypothetical protein DFH08DRAFT_983522 [Mycena albidolilacea]|uniref:Uncharacterized protein n=1 Tax=Mycena albidolilacea TaxID=1033008 RepID=A0AAD7F4V4_9AGAR|nr:hypothetical protein DFH08DRAFT_983522 [Mycena albidolilacea]
MPHQPTATEIHLNNIVAYLTPTITLLKELNDAFGPPFIQPISNTVETLISIVQNVKHNKNQCAQLMENIHQVLYAIINLYLKSETAGSLDPAMLDYIGKTLHKIYTFVETQQDRNKIKYLFHNNEIQNLLKDCHVGLDQAVEVFTINTRPAMAYDIGEMKKTAKTMHEELLELIQTLSDTNTSSDGSLVYLGTNDLKNSSNSFSMLPSKPKIFYGQESELDHIMKMLAQQPARIAILGGESATTSIELAALIGLHIGLDPGKDLTRAVVQYFSRAPSLFLILDNLETVWDPIQSQGGIEEFLSLLTDVEHLTLIITMRGAERPAKVHWTHPFLSPLEPLSDEAAQQTFMDITDNVYAAEDVNQILGFTDNMPLAVDLITHLSDYEACQMSCKELLSLLSILPDGLTAAQLAHGNLPISNILSCKAALLATSLAYQDSNKQLRSLVPIREHIQRFLPPSKALIQFVHRHFYALLELYQTYNGEQLWPVINQITLNLGNLREVLQRGYNLLHTIPKLLPKNHQLGDQLKIQFTIEVLKAHTYPAGLDPQQLITEAIVLFKHVGNPLLECGQLDYSNTVSQAEYHLLKSEYAQARNIYIKIVETSSPDQNVDSYANAFLNIALVDIKIGGDAEDVYYELSKARDIFSAHNIEIGNLSCCMVQADLELREKKFDTAKSKFLESLESGGRNNEIQTLCLERLADIRAWPASTWQSRWPVIYCAYAYKSKEKLALHKALLFLGDVFIADNDEETATNAYIVALEGFTYMDIHQSRAQCMIRLGDLAEGQGHISEAIAFWEEARPLFEWSLQAKDVAQIDARLSTTEKAHQKALLELVTSHAPVHSVVEETRR